MRKLLMIICLAVVLLCVNEPISAAADRDELIMGRAQLPPEQMVRYVRQYCEAPKLNCSIEELVRLYYAAGEAEGVRADIAICQAMLETGNFFSISGVVEPEQNNYCGLGATDGNTPGHSFSSPAQGVMAHIQHLVCYAKGDLPRTPLVDPRYYHVVNKRPDIYGKMPRWVDLNGRWAVPGDNYGEIILSYWEIAKSVGNEAAEVSFIGK